MRFEAPIFFENSNIVIYNKPAGLSSIGGQERTLNDMLPKGHALCHRIDKFTSGLILTAKNRHTVSQIMRGWHDNTQKTYLAIIKTPTWNEKLVDLLLDG